jgi:hypothetical protein
MTRIIEKSKTTERFKCCPSDTLQSTVRERSAVSWYWSNEKSKMTTIRTGNPAESDDKVRKSEKNDSSVWGSIGTYLPWSTASPSAPSSSPASTSTSASASSSRSPSLTSYLPQDPIIVGVLSALAGTGLTVVSIVGYRRYWRRIRNSDYVTSTMIDKKRWVRGVVTR